MRSITPTIGVTARRDWSRHAANIAAGYGPDAAYVRAYLDSYFEGKLTESERRNMSAKIADGGFQERSRARTERSRTTGTRSRTKS